MTEFLEGIAPDVTPISHDAMSTFSAGINEWNQKGGDFEGFAKVMIESHKLTIKALAKVELELRFLESKQNG